MTQQTTITSRRRLLETASVLGGMLIIAPLMAACTPRAVPPGVETNPSSPSGTASKGTVVQTVAAGSPVGITPTATPEPRREAASGRAKVIEVWTTIGGTGFPQLVRIVEAFEQKHPDIGVRLVFGGGYPQNETKLLTAVAGGKPPDATWVDGTQVSSWAVAGGLKTLDSEFKAANIQPDDYWPPSWKQNIWKGNIYAITLGSDTNFGFFWNKDVFQDAGLDPEKPPETITDVDAFQEKIFRKQGGNIVRMGIIPWTVYGNGNSMYTWGWVFGGEFYDETSGKVTADHELNVRALEWIVDNYAKKYDVSKIAGFQAGFGTGENHPFFVGKVGMAPLGPWELPNIQRFAPKLKYGITFMPAGPPPARPHDSWVGGWCLGIPQGAKNGDVSWTFLEYMCHSDEGTSLVGTLLGNFPGYRKSPYYANVVDKDPRLKIFHDILKESRHQRPVIPVQAFYWQALGRALDNAIYGRQSPKQALAEASRDTQKELDRVLKRG